ncbi:MAG: AAA family ATPase [Candidatus Aenigmatarchaeota archaeon]|nr:AAA family ATPase [Candidatus Aenigmarchaeota archaeon]
MNLLINPGVLESSFLPRLLPYREEEHKYIAECIKPLLLKRNGRNILITGSPGIGKTACVKFIFRKMIEENVGNYLTIYINCWKHDTNNKIIYYVAEQIGIRTNERYPEELIDIIIKKLNTYEGVVFAFDEVDRLHDWNFIYRILEDIKYKSIILITNTSENIIRLDERLLSRLLLERIEFKKYNFEEIRGILREREFMAFKPNSFEYEAFEEIVRKTYEIGDLRVGLFLLKNSAENAENRNSEKIEMCDVLKAIERIKDIYHK